MERQHQHRISRLGVHILRSGASDGDGSREVGSQAEPDIGAQQPLHVDARGAPDADIDADAEANAGADADTDTYGCYGNWGGVGQESRSRGSGTDPRITRYYDIAGAEERWHWCTRQRLWRAYLRPATSHYSSTSSNERDYSYSSRQPVGENGCGGSNTTWRSTCAWQQQRPPHEQAASRLASARATNGYCSQQQYSSRNIPPAESGTTRQTHTSRSVWLERHEASREVGSCSQNCNGVSGRHKSRALLMRSTSTSARSIRGRQIEGPILEEDSCGGFEREPTYTNTNAAIDGRGSAGGYSGGGARSRSAGRALYGNSHADEAEWNALRSELDNFGEELSNARLASSHSYAYDPYARASASTHSTRQLSAVGNGHRSPSPSRDLSPTRNFSRPDRSPSPTRRPEVRYQSPVRYPMARSPSPSRNVHIQLQCLSPSYYELYGPEEYSYEEEWPERSDWCGPAGDGDSFERHLTQARRELELFGDTVAYYKQWNACV